MNAFETKAPNSKSSERGWMQRSDDAAKTRNIRRRAGRRTGFPCGVRQACISGRAHREFELLRVGDITAIEMAIQFLEANPWYFRSGYHKADILKMLRKHLLSDDQSARMRNLISNASGAVQFARRARTLALHRK